MKGFASAGGFCSRHGHERTRWNGDCRRPDWSGAGRLDPWMFTVIMMVAIVTSLVAPPLLGWSLRGIPERPGDAERTERERILGKLPFIREGAKLLVLDAGGPHVQMAKHLAAALGNHHEASLEPKIILVDSTI